MVLSAFAFSVMAVCVKHAVVRLPTVEVVFVRALVAVALSAIGLAWAGVAPLGVRRGLLLVRGMLGFGGLHCVFYAVAHLPLAEAMVLQYLHPIFTALLAWRLLGESVGRGVAVGVPLSLLGVLLVTGTPAGDAALDPFAVGVAVAGAFLSGCAYVVVRRLSRSEHPLVIVLYFPMVTVPATLPWVLANPVWPVGLEWLWLLGVGVAAQVGQVALTRGMQHEPAARATALSYLQVVFAAFWGAAVFAEVPGPAAILGGGLILVGSFAAGRER
ncbi:MAG: DMT family transporter [bacterium]|nr:DMT family transporter [bacterium]MCP5065840.1 DMT family transporter [bacterium]